MLVEFSIYWKSRLFLVLIGAFWVVSPFPADNNLSTHTAFLVREFVLGCLVCLLACAICRRAELLLQATWEPEVAQVMLVLLLIIHMIASCS